eukprot:3626974-Lingulodinium_polyedra.AAC.2
MQILDITKNLEKKHEEFTYNASQMKYARETRRPTNAYVRVYQELVEEKTSACWKQMNLWGKRNPRNTPE